MPPTSSEHMTPRDLLCHRSGLPRHDLLWYNNQDPLEPTVKPIVFTKQAARGLYDPAVLRRYTGEYEMGPLTMTVELERETTLMASVAGQARVELVPYEDRTFKIKEQPSTVVEFVLALDGSVEKVVVPGAVFTPKAG